MRPEINWAPLFHNRCVAMSKPQPRAWHPLTQVHLSLGVDLSVANQQASFVLAFVVKLTHFLLRAAAARCRQKRKSWIGNLEYKAEELQNTNTKLQVQK